HLDGAATQIVGVMPKGFAFPDPDTEMLLPDYVDPKLGFGTFGTSAIARLAPGVSLDAARKEVSQLQSRISELYPDVTQDFLKKAGWSASVQTLRDSLVSDA